GAVTTGSATIFNSAANTTSTLTVNGTASTSYAGLITNGTSGTSLVALTKSGTGTLGLGGVNTYTGPTTITSGTLKLGTGGSISGSSKVNISAGGIFDTTALTSGTFVMLGSQTFKFALDPAGSGLAGLLNATGLNIT